MRYTVVFLFLLISLQSLVAQEVAYETMRDIVYTSNPDSYSKERCKLDFHFPKDKKSFTTLVWFHGGGLTGGDKKIPSYLMDKGIGIVAVSYRLSPHVKVDSILEDAADAVKWVYEHIGDKGGATNKIVIGGYSAGAYLSLMLGLNKSYLLHRGIDTGSLLGIISISGQAITHFTARKESGIDGLQPVVDRLAPLYWVRKEAPKLLLITGDRELEMMGRYEENAYLYRMLKLTGNTDVELLELQGYGHNTEYPSFPLLLKTVDKWAK